MAFDGITVAALCYELNEKLKDGRVNKIAQPEEDELLFTIKTYTGQIRLLMSASASLPLVYITDSNKPSPQTAPAFCMLLRKYLTNSRILSVTQPGLERAIHIEFEHRDELGDLRTKKIIIELMGKHSNIIFVKEDGTIIDSIKRVSAAVSSVREVLPGREYFLPEMMDKANPLDCTDTESAKEVFINGVKSKTLPIYKAIYSAYTGISPIFAQEICYRAKVDSDIPAQSLNDIDISNLYREMSVFAEAIREHSFEPQIIYKDGLPVEFSVFTLSLYDGYETKKYTCVSELLGIYYSERNVVNNIRQRSSDLRKVVTNLLERNVKKYDLQLKQMNDTQKRDKYKVYGELINTYGYSVAAGAKSMEALNYYTNETITIPLDETLSPSQNAQKYFDKYNKLKRTYDALSTLTVEVAMEIEHLQSVLNSLDIARSEEDLIQIKEELIESGVIKRKANSKKVKITSKPFHFVTEDGFHIYVGKNNLQNDELTFKFANGSDWWFHAKKIPGSHVVLKTEGREVPDKVFELAAAAAGYYSKGADQPKVEIDYVQRKEVKKPAGAKPGFVVYYTNYSMAIAPGIDGLSVCE